MKKEHIKTYFNDELDAIKNLDNKRIEELISKLENALINNQTIYIFGNGGSGSTASHFVADFNKSLFNKIDKRFNFKCLNDNIPIMLAISNDYGYEDVFLNQLKGRVSSSDIIIAISGSGNSKNIIEAVSYAKKEGAFIVGLTGYDGGKLSKLSDLEINSGINNMQITEDIHLIIEHLIISYFHEKYEVM